MNYTDVFGAQTVPPSEESYVFHNLSGADNQLYWPEQYSGAGYLLADITELTGAGVVAVRLPAADAVSVGESFLLRNRCLDDIQVNDASGAPAALLPAGQTLFFYVVDNTTPAGQWQIFTFGAGTSAADAVALAGDGLSVATGRLRVSSEYRAINSSYPIVAEDRGQILDVVTGTITVTTPDATTAGDGFYCFIRNSSAGNLTLDGYGTQTVNGVPSVTFAPGDSVILMSTGTNWVTVGYGRSVSGQFSEVIVNAAAGNVTLSSSDVAGRMIRVAGTATADITVTLPAIDNIYFVVVEAGMGSYGAIFTTGSGAVTVLTASQRTVLTSDGTNVLAAVTTTVTSSLALVDGSAVAPSIGFSLDPDTGLFRKGNNVIGVAAGGAEVGSFGSSGFVGNVTGNAATATTLSSYRNNWATQGSVNAVVGQLAWRRFGNDHTIFDASSSTDVLGNPCNNVNPRYPWAPDHPNLMGFNGTDTFGVRVDSSRFADALVTARTIGGVSFDGTANINLPGVNIAGNQDTSGNAATVTNGVYTTGTQTITGNKTFSGTTTFSGTVDGTALVNKMFPVGAIYITVGNTNPGTFLGGTWAQIAQGRTLIGVGTLGGDTYAAGDTGGSSRVTLSISEIPSHNHGGATGGQSTNHTHSGTTASDGTHTHTVKEGAVAPTAGGVLTSGDDMTNYVAAYQTSSSSGDHTHTFTTAGVSVDHTHAITAQGGGTAHENRMPYLAVYFWQRTA